MTSRPRACTATSFALILALTSAASVATAATSSRTITDPGRTVRTSPMLRPDFKAVATDPDFGTRLRRVTDAARRGSFATQIYSQLQAFSSNDRYLLLIDRDRYVIRRRSDLVRMPLDTSGWNAPRWYPAEPDSIISFDSNDDQTVRVIVTDVETGASRTAFTSTPMRLSCGASATTFAAPASVS